MSDSERIKKSNLNWKYYVWQVEAYGESHYYADLPCEIYKDRPMPCTPAGDLLGAVPTARQALELVDQIERMDLESARTYVRAAVGS